MLFDSHAHVAFGAKDIRFRPEYTLETLINEMDRFHIDKSVVMINPLFKLFKCPKDNKHKITVQDSENSGVLKLYCMQCQKVLYEGPDPMREFNLELMDAVSGYGNRFFPMLTVTLANSTIPGEVEFYEKYYPKSFTGYKLHPRICFRGLDEISFFPSNRPVLIHTGVDYPPTPTNVDFAKKYKGNILLAHAGRFDPDLIFLAKNFPNVYIDTAPSSLMFKGHITDLLPPFNTLIESPADIYKYLIQEIGEDKILFGSDVPWGNYEDEISILHSANLPQDVYEKIAYRNLISALKFG